MNDIAKISLGAAWEEAIAFVRSEFSLLLPLALLGFGLPMVVLQLIEPEKLVQNNEIVTGPWLLWSIPHGLLSLLGTLSISALALNPGMSVRESLALAFSRLLGGIAVALLGFSAFLVLMVLFLAVASFDIGAGGQLGPIAILAFLCILSILFFVAVRVLPVWAVLIERPIGPIAAIRRAFVLTQGRYPKLLLLRIVALVSEIVVAFVLLAPIAVVFDLLSRLSGAASVMTMLSLLVGSTVAAGIVTIWTVYVARLTVRLGGSIGGI